MADVFVGFVFDEDKEKELLHLSKCGVGTAANQYQKGFISGLSERVIILSTISTGAFPRMNKRLFFPIEQKSLPEGEFVYLPFINCYFFRDFMFENGLYRHLSRIIESQQHTTVYVYSLYMPSLRAMARLKEQYGDKLHYCLIIPYLPGKYGLVRSGIKGIRDRYEVRAKMTLPNQADSFVFLTDAMKELFEPKPYAVIEGFLPKCEFDYSKRRIPKTVLYTGSLNRAFGLDTLLNAFSQIEDEDAQLWICGAGDMEAEIKEAASEDPRIIFKGFLPKSEITALQTQCDVLINPRLPEGEYTKYSFPSKTMEYLLSGSKVVMHRLPGIPDEYYQYIRIIDGYKPQAIADAIDGAFCDKEFYESRWQEQVNWIQTSKNSREGIRRLKV